MTPRELRQLDKQLQQYLESMTSDMGRPERRRAMAGYITGLLLDGERKSIEPIAARLVDDAAQIQGMRQRLQQCVCVSTWSDDEMFRRLALKLDAELPGVEALVLDDTGFPKKGTHSVGVQRQYSGTLGRVDNCQIAVSLHLAGEHGSGCIGMRLFLPDSWAADADRCRAVGVPGDVVFMTKWEIALKQLDDALDWGVRRHLVLADAGFGDVGEFRDGLYDRGLKYVVGISGQPVVWSPESNPQIPQRSPGQRGRPFTNYRDEVHPPTPIAELATSLRYRKVSWREGSRGTQSSRFAAVRIRTAHRHLKGAPPGPEQWLLCQRADDGKKPPKYWLSNLPATTSLKELVRVAKLRWRIERDYQEMKQELGLDHFEGRTWRGFHHHATLCAVAHGFLALNRALSPPEQDEALDAASGQATASASAPSSRRVMPAMPPTRRRREPTAWTLADVIE